MASCELDLGEILLSEMSPSSVLEKLLSSTIRREPDLSPPTQSFRLRSNTHLFQRPFHTSNLSLNVTSLFTSGDRCFSVGFSKSVSSSLSRRSTSEKNSQFFLSAPLFSLFRVEPSWKFSEPFQGNKDAPLRRLRSPTSPPSALEEGFPSSDSILCWDSSSTGDNSTRAPDFLGWPKMGSMSGCKMFHKWRIQGATQRIADKSPSTQLGQTSNNLSQCTSSKMQRENALHEPQMKLTNGTTMNSHIASCRVSTVNAPFLLSCTTTHGYKAKTIRSTLKHRHRAQNRSCNPENTAKELKQIQQSTKHRRRAQTNPATLKNTDTKLKQILQP